jgi:hypothetical protein
MSDVVFVFTCIIYTYINVISSALKLKWWWCIYVYGGVLCVFSSSLVFFLCIFCKQCECHYLIHSNSKQTGVLLLRATTTGKALASTNLSLSIPDPVAS